MASTAFNSNNGLGNHASFCQFFRTPSAKVLVFDNAMGTGFIGTMYSRTGATTNSACRTQVDPANPLGILPGGHDVLTTNTFGVTGWPWGIRLADRLADIHRAGRLRRGGRRGGRTVFVAGSIGPLANAIRGSVDSDDRRAGPALMEWGRQSSSRRCPIGTRWSSALLDGRSARASPSPSFAVTDQEETVSGDPSSGCSRRCRGRGQPVPWA